MSIGSSFDMHRRALDCIAQGALTNSKRPESFVKGVYPTHIVSGAGAFLVDERGKKYVDFLCALGTNLVGYGNQSIRNALARQANNGFIFSLGSVLEVQAAERFKQIIPFIDTMKFLKTGTEACIAALKIARAYNGRIKILSEGYHGWSDEFVSLLPPALGVPQQSNIERLIDIEQINETVSAVIIEPIMSDASVSRIEWLKELREKCTQTDTVLIFDEIITGFRFPQYTASKFFGIYPDLICMGKAIGGGLPLSLVGGKKKYMACGEYFVSSTFAGDTTALACALELIHILHNKLQLSDLFEKANMFQERFNKIAPEIIRIEGYGTRGTFIGEPIAKALFCQEACRSGILFHPSTFFFNFCHVDLADQVLNTVTDILNKIKSGGVKLLGEMPSSPFAAKMREKQ